MGGGLGTLRQVCITFAQFYSINPEFRFCAGSNSAGDMLRIYDLEYL